MSVCVCVCVCVVVTSTYYDLIFYRFFDSVNDLHGKGKGKFHPRTGHEASEGE